jgi:hypothetical protein
VRKALKEKRMSFGSLQRARKNVRNPATDDPAIPHHFLKCAEAEENRRVATFLQ